MLLSGYSILDARWQMISGIGFKVYGIRFRVKSGVRPSAFGIRSTAPGWWKWWKEKNSKQEVK